MTETGERSARAVSRCARGRACLHVGVVQVVGPLGTACTAAHQQGNLRFRALARWAGTPPSPPPKKHHSQTTTPATPASPHACPSLRHHHTDAHTPAPLARAARTLRRGGLGRPEWQQLEVQDLLGRSVLQLPHLAAAAAGGECPALVAGLDSTRQCSVRAARRCRSLAGARTFPGRSLQRFAPCRQAWLGACSWRAEPADAHLLSGIHSGPPSMMMRPLAVGTCTVVLPCWWGWYLQKPGVCWRGVSRQRTGAASGHRTAGHGMAFPCSRSRQAGQLSSAS